MDALKFRRVGHGNWGKSKKREKSHVPPRDEGDIKTIQTIP